MNPWLDNEIKQLEFEYSNNRRKTSMIKILTMISSMLLLAANFIYGDIVDTHCPHCQAPISFQIEMGTWTKNWNCPQCGYENWPEISNCGVCGTPKPKR